ncbi:hypothetical protein NSTC745_05313 [Nostoc sp. DSM 114161]|jgi:putative membrane protein
MKLIRRSTWLDLAIDLRSSVISAIWRRVLATMIFAFIIAIAYHKGFAVNQPTLAGLICWIPNRCADSVNRHRCI